MKKKIAILLCIVSLNSVGFANDEGLSVTDSILNSIGNYSKCSSVPIPFEVIINPDKNQLNEGLNDFVFSIKLKQACDYKTVEIKEIDNLSYFGPVSWEIDAAISEVKAFAIKLDIPKNDTSGLVIRICCNQWCQNFTVYFVDTEDTTYSYSINPRLVDVYNSREAIKQRAIDSLKKLEKPRGPSSRVGHYDKEGNFVPQDSIVEKEKSPMQIAIEKYNWQSGDTTVIWMRDEEGNYYLKDVADYLQVR